MALLRPALLALGLLAIPIILLYILRLRRQEWFVSSTMLWQQLLRDREANTPWQRLRRNLLLLLQLLLLAALVVAMARPFLPVPSIVSGNVVVLLDGSASMLATDVSPSRFVLARELVLQAIDELGANDQMTLILVGASPVVLASATSDRSELREALAVAQATAVVADWPSAVALASGAAQGFREAQIVVVSDGGLPNDLPPSPVPVSYLQVGERGDNLAISALATRPQGSRSQLLVGVTNYGEMERLALLSIWTDGRLFDSRRVAVPPGGVAHESWLLPGATSAIEARMSATEGDFLDLDNNAWAVGASAAAGRALLVSEGNRFLETALGLMPGIELFRRSPTDFGAGFEPEDADFIILDSLPLDLLQDGVDLLLVGPQPGGPGGSLGEAIDVGQTFTRTALVSAVDDPILQFVDWTTVNVREARLVDAPWARPLVSAEAGPLLLAGEIGSQRVAILTFTLQDSDLPLQIAFPVLLANITNWLSPGQVVAGPTSVAPGDPVLLRADSSSAAVAVRGPGGAIWQLAVDGGPVTFTATEQPGLYAVILLGPDGERRAGHFAVNLFSDQESDIYPADVLQFGGNIAATSETDRLGQRELWPWLAAVGLALLALEWSVYHHGRPGLTWGGRVNVLIRRRWAQVGSRGLFSRLRSPWLPDR
jgi:Ca-activated chloride channel homolog